MKKIKSILKSESFVVAFRKKDSSASYVFEDWSTLRSFSFVKNPVGKWRADPFLFEQGANTFLFVEEASRITGKGILKVCRLNDKHPKFKTVLKRKYHLSFPNVFRFRGKIFMVPETGESGSVQLFECVSSIYHWSESKTLLNNTFSVDSFFLGEQQEDTNELWTYDLGKNSLMLYRLTTDGSYELANSIADPDYTLRPAGRPFYFRGDLMVPFQDCRESYGGGIYFAYANDLSALPNVAFRFCCNKDFLNSLFNTTIFWGIHTYSCTNSYEVVDFKIKTFSFIGFLGKVLQRFIVFRKRPCDC